MNTIAKNITPDTQDDDYGALDAALEALDAAKDKWANTDIPTRIRVLNDIKDALMTQAGPWAITAARHKQIPLDSPLVGEEWISGPYALMDGCNGLLHTLSHMKGKTYLDHLKTTHLPGDRIGVEVVPHSIWNRLLLSGVKATVWMQPGVTHANLKAHSATAYDTPEGQRKGKVALILGAGNIAGITPLDAFQKLFLENQVVIIKMNPVNDYLTPFLERALAPLIKMDALRIVKGDGAVGAYLTNHPLIEEMHITGAEATHDAIVWGQGAEGKANKAKGTPKNAKRITSELGAVCPTIIVPGPWSDADIRFQAEHIATQKLHNSGFNCVACQVLITPKSWDKLDDLMRETQAVMAKNTRPAYYPGAKDRLEKFAAHCENVVRIDRGKAPGVVITNTDADAFYQTEEIFAPALSRTEIAGDTPEDYLIKAIQYANDALHGTLGANIIIHPKTIKAIGRKRFNEILTELRYGGIAINAWTGLGFLLSATPWGAFPGHTLDNVGSGIGTVHNTFMLDKTERTVVEAPWRPFPRGVISGQLSLLPRPPWFITNTRQHKIGELLVNFQYKPSFLKLPRIFINAILG